MAACNYSALFSSNTSLSVSACLPQTVQTQDTSCFPRGRPASQSTCTAPSSTQVLPYSALQADSSICTFLPRQPSLLPHPPHPSGCSLCCLHGFCDVCHSYTIQHLPSLWSCHPVMAEWSLLSMSAFTGRPRASCCLLEPCLPWLADGSVLPGCTQLTASRLGSDSVSLPLNVFMTVLLNTFSRAGAAAGLP